MKSETDQTGCLDNVFSERSQSTTVQKPVTPSSSGPAETFTLPSPSSSPLSDQSPRKALSSWQQEQRSNEGHGQSGQTGSENSVKSALSNKLKSMKAAQSRKDNSVTKPCEHSGNSAIVVETNKAKMEQKSAKNSNKRETTKQAIVHEQKNDISRNEKVAGVNLMEEMEIESSREIKKGQDQMEAKDIDFTGAHTPGNEMETDEGVKSHVRKINFDAVGQNLEQKELISRSLSMATRGNATEPKQGETNLINCSSASSEALSKSTGFINFKQLLKDPNIADLNLNKSMGFMEKSATSVRSAFVPVQSINRKDGTNNQSVAMAIPVIIPSAVTSQSAACLPTSSNSSMIGGAPSIFSLQNRVKESINVVTVTSVLSKMPASDILVSSNQNSQAFARQTRSKFTPIRPKASPTKACPSKEPKCELGQSYDKDKRPVAAILKEKRAKEQAEAMAKQAGLTLQTIHLPNLSSNQISASSSLPNDVVIIVNNQPFIDSSGGNMISQATVTGSGLQLTTQSIDDYNSQDITINKGVMSSELTSANLNVEASKVKTVKFVTDANFDKTDNIKLGQELGQYSPMDNTEGDVTPILEERDSTPEMDVANDSMERRGTLRYPVHELEEEYSEMKEETSSWIETPSKIAKLNINSPFRPDSACSLGRETPVKITKSESSQSRPESACSYGRETPSGARKRKSSETQARRDIKRLNSTGEEMEDGTNMSTVLSPESDDLNVRRTRSCTYELEKGCRVKSQQQSTKQQQHQQQAQVQQHRAPQSKTGISLQGLQSPDINCLEREALMESFPNSLSSMKPGRSYRNQSVGVSSRSLRHSQQKLKSQQHDLDQRVKNYFQTKAEVNEASEGKIGEKGGNKHFSVGSNLHGPPSGRSSANTESMVVSDRGKPYIRPASVVTVGHSSNSAIEPSGLPSDVADWINEAMEKRQKENQSVSSEPDLHRNQSSSGEKGGKNLRNFNFEMDTSLFGVENDWKKHPEQSLIPTQQNEPKGLVTKGNKDDNTFTVPKAPPISNQRQKDHNMRLTNDQTSNNQRCQSLPIFASLAQSPVSPVASPISGVHGYQRALSMSPRGQPMEVNTDMLSPVSNTSPRSCMMSPDRRKESNEGFQISFNQPGIQSMNKVRPYLKRIQHSLQKPVDHLPRQTPPMSTNPAPEKLIMTLPLSQGQGQGHYQGQGLQLTSAQNPPLHSRESSLEVEERYISQTPFSDSGYQSSGPSPILNSTPVSTMDSLDVANLTLKHSVAESPVSMVTDFTSPIPNIITHLKSPIRHQLPTLPGQQVLASMTTIQSTNQNPSINGGILRSSMNSAFIPIQGSHGVRYVTPIKPTVTLPSSVSQGQSGGNSLSVFIDLNEQIASSDITMVSPIASAPPSYEMAMKHLQRAGPVSDSTHLQNSTNPGAEIDSNTCMNKSDIFPSQILAEDRIPIEHSDALGPFAAKLKLLSQQTQSDMDTNNILLNLLSPTSETDAITTTALTHIPVNELPSLINSSQSSSLNLNSIQSVSLNQNEAGNSKSANEIIFPIQNINTSESILLYNACVHPNPRLRSQSVLETKSAKNINQASFTLGNPENNSVLNLDPSFHLSPSSANQNTDNSVMTSLSNLNDNLLMVDSPDENQLSLTDTTEFLPEDMGLDLDSLKDLDGQYFNGGDDSQVLSQFDMLI